MPEYDGLVETRKLADSPSITPKGQEFRSAVVHGLEHAVTEAEETMCSRFLSNNENGFVMQRRGCWWRRGRAE